MSQLILTNDSSTTPFAVTRPGGGGRPDILNTDGGSVTYDDPSSGRYTVEAATQVVAFSVGSSLKAKVKVALAGGPGGPGAVITFINGGGPPYTLKSPDGEIALVGPTREYREVGDYTVNFPNGADPWVLTFLGISDVTVTVTTI